MTIGRRDLVVDRPEGASLSAVTYDVSVRQCREDGRHVGVTEVFPLRGVLRIGTDAASDILLEGRRVEPFHATVEPTGRGLLLTLLGEAEAVIGDRVVRGTWGLLPGDAMRIGDYQITVDLGPENGDSTVDWNLVSRDGQASLQLVQAVSLGQDDSCDLKMIDDDVSPVHASLVPVGGTLWIRDLSGGATFVNDQQVVGGMQLRDRDVLRMGPSVAFRIVERRRPEGAATRAPMPPLAADPRSAERSNRVQMDALVTNDPVAPNDARPAIDRRPVRQGGSRGVRPHRPAGRSSLDQAVTPSPKRRPEVLATEVVDARPIDSAPPAAAPQSRTAAPVDVSRPVRRRRAWPWATPVVVLGVAAASWVLIEGGQLRDRAGPAVAPLPSAASGAPLISTVTTETGAAEEEIAALREAAEAGDAAATSRLRELHRAYEERAAAALANDDVGAAPGLLRLAALIESALAPAPETPAPAESVLPAPRMSEPARVASALPEPAVTGRNTVAPAAPSQTRVSSGNPEIEEARRLYAERALVTPTGKNATALTIAILQKDPSNIEVARLLDSTIGELERQVRLLLSEHRFDAASSLLSAARRAGIPVDAQSASHDRPPYVPVERWNALRVACLLIEADAMIQVERIVAPGELSAITLLQEAVRLDPTNPVALDMAEKAAGHLLQSARRAEQAGRMEEASRLVNLASYVRESTVERIAR